MSARWRILDFIDFSGKIEVRRGRVMVQGQEEPLADVACILTGVVTQFSGSLLAVAARFDVPILTCDWRGVPIASTLPWSDNSRVGARHQAQADLSLPRRKNAWMRIVRAKILGQANNLPDGTEQQERLIELANSVRSGDPTNTEARAARTYWSFIFKPEPFSRNPDLLGRNAHLNYGYAVVRGALVRAISVAGLSPTLGLWHHNRANAFSLADDLIEPFRPAVDAVVSALPYDAELADRSVKAAIVTVLSTPMAESGPTVMTSVNELAQHYAQYVEGELPVLSVPIWTPTSG